MAKYLLLWEVDSSRIAEDPGARKQHWNAMQEAVKQQLEAGQMSDWGLCVGELTGYCIVEGTQADVAKVTRGYVPWVNFQVSEVASIHQAMENLEGLE